jgi:hypothetical protein
LPAPLAILYSGLGDDERAFESLEKAYRERIPYRVVFEIDENPLRPNPRFNDLVQRISLPSSRRAAVQ